MYSIVPFIHGIWSGTETMTAQPSANGTLTRKSPLVVIACVERVS